MAKQKREVEAFFAKLQKANMKNHAVKIFSLDDGP
jgi:hypothetical protein